MSAAMMNTTRSVNTRTNGPRGSSTATAVVRPMTAQIRPMAATIKPRQQDADVAPLKQRSTRRVACAAAPGQKSAGVVTAVRDEHRNKVLVETATDFLHSWTRAVTEGPTGDAMKKLDFLVDNAANFEERDLGQVHSGKGIDGLKQWLERLHSRYSPKGHKILLLAANDVDDEVYALLEYQHQEKGGDASHVHHDYKVLKIEILADEANRRVMDVQQYGQLEPAHLRSAAIKANVSRSAFPSEMIRSGKGPDPQDAREIAETWVTARSNADVSALTPLIDTASFKLYDSYHVLPDPSGGGSGSGSEQATSFSWAQVQDTINGSKAAYDQEFKLLDNAVAQNANAGFTHWRAHYKPLNKAAGKDESFEVEGVQVDIYSADGKKLQAAWVFRDPTPAEKTQLKNA